MLAEASHLMRLQLYAGNSLLRWKGLVEWKRAHRAFFKLIISAWRMWAGAHKRATAVAVAAGSRHKVTALAQHFEILMQHTLYRRRLNAGAVLRIQTASLSGTRSAVQQWRTGFYHIALGAGVPLVIGMMDYGKRTGGGILIYGPPGCGKTLMLRAVAGEVARVHVGAV
jgi:hypothetical protein